MGDLREKTCIRRKEKITCKKKIRNWKGYIAYGKKKVRTEDPPNGIK